MCRTPPASACCLWITCRVRLISNRNTQNHDTLKARRKLSCIYNFRSCTCSHKSITWASTSVCLSVSPKINIHSVPLASCFSLWLWALSVCSGRQLDKDVGFFVRASRRPFVYLPVFSWAAFCWAPSATVSIHTASPKLFLHLNKTLEINIARSSEAFIYLIWHDWLIESHFCAGTQMKKKYSHLEF